MSFIKETLKRHGELPSFYRRCVDDTLTVMPDATTATDFLHTLNNVHTSIKFTMEVEKNGTDTSFPWHSTVLPEWKPRFTDLKPTNTGLLLQYQSHVDNCYKRS